VDSDLLGEACVRLLYAPAESTRIRERIRQHHVSA
jgi:hypothetical protein